MTVTCSPSASFSGTNGTTGGVGESGATINYSANVYPVTVNLTGQNTANQALTGQQITASLNGVPYSSKVTYYTWSINGGATFDPIKNWNEKGLATDGKTPQQLFPLTSADYTATDTTGRGIPVNPISFYDQAAGVATVTCAVWLTFPNGTTGVANASSTPVTFLKPTLKWIVATGYVQPAAQAGYFALLPAPSTGYPGGEYWQSAAITVPSPFSGGLGCFAQIITPDFEMLQDGSNVPVVAPNNKVEGLDNAFPYVNYQWNLPISGTQSDTPAIGVAGVNTPNYQGWNTATRDDQFSTWVMYKPPAFGSQGIIWVPLQSYSWNWSCTLQWLNSQWTITSSSPNAANRAGPRTPADSTTAPSWSFVQTNG